jgi:hypothetical protein
MNPFRHAVMKRGGSVLNESGQLQTQPLYVTAYASTHREGERHSTLVSIVGHLIIQRQVAGVEWLRVPTSEEARQCAGPCYVTRITDLQAPPQRTRSIFLVAMKLPALNR